MGRTLSFGGERSKAALGEVPSRIVGRKNSKATGNFEFNPPFKSRDLHIVDCSRPGAFALAQPSAGFDAVAVRSGAQHAWPLQRGPAAWCVQRPRRPLRSVTRSRSRAAAASWRLSACTVSPLSPPPLQRGVGSRGPPGVV